MKSPCSLSTIGFYFVNLEGATREHNQPQQRSTNPENSEGQLTSPRRIWARTNPTTFPRLHSQIGSCSTLVSTVTPSLMSQNSSVQQWPVSHGRSFYTVLLNYMRQCPGSRACCIPDQVAQCADALTSRGLPQPDQHGTPLLGYGKDA